MQNKTLISLLITLFFTLFGSSYAAANAVGDVAAGKCENANLIGTKLITDVCWSCVFPIKVMGIQISPSRDSHIPDDAANQPLCYCKDDLGIPRVGFTTSMWEPARLIEFQRTAGCSSVLNGVRFPFDPVNRGVHSDGEYDMGEQYFLHYHYYAFPLTVMLDLFTAKHCNAGGYLDLDLMYLSEVDPTWNNDELAFFTNPEAAFVSNPVATLACIPDAISSTAGHPIKELFWCAGSWGTMYPLSGNQTGGNGVIQETSLMKVKALAALHRRGLAWGTVGKDALCGGEIKIELPKQQYKFTLFHPIPETQKSHVMGQSTLLWGGGRLIPGVSEDPIYLIWRWKDCCNW